MRMPGFRNSHGARGSDGNWQTSLAQNEWHARSSRVFRTWRFSVLRGPEVYRRRRAFVHEARRHQYREGCWHPINALNVGHAGSIPAAVAQNRKSEGKSEWKPHPEVTVHTPTGRQEIMSQRVSGSFSSRQSPGRLLSDATCLRSSLGRALLSYWRGTRFESALRLAVMAKWYTRSVEVAVSRNARPDSTSGNRTFPRTRSQLPGFRAAGPGMHGSGEEAHTRAGPPRLVGHEPATRLRVRQPVPFCRGNLPRSALGEGSKAGPRSFNGRT